MEEIFIRKNKKGEMETLDPKSYRLEEIERELEEKDTFTNKAKGILGGIGNEIKSISAYQGRRPPFEVRYQDLGNKLAEIKHLKNERQKLKVETDPEIKRETRGMKKGGKVKKYASGGSVSSASKRADGCAQRGKTKGRIV